MKPLIKTLDWNNISFPGKKEEFIQEICDSFHNIGFVAIKNHPIPVKLFQENELIASDFFTKLSVEKRMNYSFPETGYQVGYTPISIEKGEFASVADNKHFYHYSEEGNNPYVKEIPVLKSKFSELFSSCNSFYRELMAIVALSLRLEETYFDDQLGNSILRHLHYPATSRVTSSDEEVTRGGNILGMCASKHTDINFLTLLYAVNEGLQLWYNNAWMKVISDPDTIIINVGDMLEHLTAGFYKSAIHRVVCVPQKERYSTPFFGHIKEHCSIEPLKGFQWMNLGKFNFTTAGEFLDHRLKAIGVKT